MKIPPQEIGFDFDGVIADIGEAFLRIACQKYDYCSLSLDEITSFQVESCTDIPLDIAQRIFTAILEDSVSTGLLPVEGAQETLTRLALRSKVTIITARSLHTPVANWFDKYFNKAACDNINIFAMGNHDDKVRFIEEHNLGYFVDDRAETCEQVAEAGYVPLLFRQPWNRNWNNFTTVSNWQEIAALIE